MKERHYKNISRYHSPEATNTLGKCKTKLSMIPPLIKFLGKSNNIMMSRSLSRFNKQGSIRLEQIMTNWSTYWCISWKLLLETENQHIKAFFGIELFFFLKKSIKSQKITRFKKRRSKPTISSQFCHKITALSNKRPNLRSKIFHWNIYGHYHQLFCSPKPNSIHKN